MINYTHITLLLLGWSGVLFHNLIQLDKQNREQNGELKLKQYWKIERFSIIISVLFICSLTVISQEIKQLQQAGKWIGAGFIAFGYFGQSLLVYVMGIIRAKAKMKLEQEENQKSL